MKRLMRRLTNDIRVLEHAACLAEGPIIGMQIDTDRAAKRMGLENVLAADLAAARATVALLQAQAEKLHDDLTALAGGADLTIPGDNVVNGPGGK